LEQKCEIKRKAHWLERSSQTVFGGVQAAAKMCASANTIDHASFSLSTWPSHSIPNCANRGEQAVYSITSGLTALSSAYASSPLTKQTKPEGGRCPFAFRSPCRLQCRSCSSKLSCFYCIRCGTHNSISEFACLSSSGSEPYQRYAYVYSESEQYTFPNKNSKFECKNPVKCTR
jgi:hypothetical protein